MKKIILPFVIALTILSSSCTSQEKEKSLEELAVDFQVAYRKFDFNSVEPFISTNSKAFAKSMYELHPILENKKEELIDSFKGKGNKVVSKKLDKKEAEVIMCCNAFGDTFPTFWVLEDDKWKVDFEKTMNYSKNKYE